MHFPRCGKVLVIDDRIEEAMPLLNILGQKGVSTIYFSGMQAEFPQAPFNEIRLVFCDLKFYASSDPKTIVSNVVGILQGLIAADNGPYILLIWSSHGTDFEGALQEQLSSTQIKPEFILRLDKTDFFKTKTNDEVFDQLLDQLSELDLDPEDERRVKELVSEKTLPMRTSTQEPIEGALSQIEAKLVECLKAANLFHLFVLWENTVGAAAIQTVNNIYTAIPDKVPSENRLNAMLAYLAYYRLEQQIKDADEGTKFAAAIESLSELYTYFLSENLSSLTMKQVGLEKIQAIEAINGLSPEKLNQWKMITKSRKGLHSGNVYHDELKRFRFHGFIDINIHDKPEEYRTFSDELVSDQEIQYYLVDLSSDCDIAQQKLFVSRVVPFIMIPIDSLEKYKKKIKSTAPDYIFTLSPVEYSGKNWCIVVNVNQMFSVDANELSDEKLKFALTGTFVTAIKQQAARCISKHGTEIFGTPKEKELNRLTTQD